MRADGRSHLPHQMVAAANELVLCLAALAVRTRMHTAGTLHTDNGSLLTRLHRAITGLVQVEGGRFTVDWSGHHVSINEYVLTTHEKLEVAAQALRKSLGTRGISGIAFRIIPDEQQLLHFFRRALTLERPEVERMGERGTLARIPGDRDLVGILILLGSPGDDGASAPGRRSGIGLRVAFEESLEASGLAWIGCSPPPNDEDEEAVQRFVLGVYTDLVSSTLRFIRLARSIRSGHAPLPTLALSRLIESVGRAYHLAPELMTACVLLGARDPAPARRIAHTVALTLGLATFRGLGRDHMAEAGLAAFIYGLRERFRQLGDGDPPELTILQLLARQSALTSQKVRAIYSAALVDADAGALGGDASQIEVPNSARLIHLAWACTGALDGSLGDRLAQAPVPMPTAYRDLVDYFGNHRGVDRELAILARWLGPVPAGTVVRLTDGRIAVTSPQRGQYLRAIPLQDPAGAPLKQPAPPVRLGRVTGQDAWPERLEMAGVVSTRQVVHLAAGALFYRARKNWQPLMAPRTGQVATP